MFSIYCKKKKNSDGLSGAPSSLAPGSIFPPVPPPPLSRRPCFDGKTLFELNKEKMLKRDRMGVLDKINEETYLLGVPPLASSTGEDQFLGGYN